MVRSETRANEGISPTLGAVGSMEIAGDTANHISLLTRSPERTDHAMERCPYNQVYLVTVSVYRNARHDHTLPCTNERRDHHVSID